MEHFQFSYFLYSSSVLIVVHFLWTQCLFVSLHSKDHWFLISRLQIRHIHICLFVLFCLLGFCVCFVCVRVCLGGPGFDSTSPARVMRAAIHVRESRGWPSQKTGR